MAAREEGASGMRNATSLAGTRATWTVAAAGCFVLLSFAVAGTIRPIPAFAGVAVIAAAAIAANAWASRARRLVLHPEHIAGEPDESVLDAIIAAVAEPVVVLDRAEHVVAFNAHATSIAPGLRKGEPALLALRAPELVDAIRRAATTTQSEHVEFSERAPSDRHFDVVIVPFDLQAGARSPFLMMTFRDLTPIRRVEEMRADFVANASHELRTPLASLAGFIETLRGAARDDPAARERFLGIMEEQAWRMARLIDDLLSLSRIELNAAIRPDKTVELAPIVRQVIDGLQMLARERGVEVSFSAPEEAITVAGDRDELLRVFENLVENALKYGGSGKRVDITLARRDGDAEVAVRDYGPGIAAEHLPRLTERFYRVDVAGSRAQGGTGLGLALVKHILNRHRGRLSVESRAGQGATFTVRMPIRNPQAA
jgi:two-component system phosphate regulon sensor histidine kinase PhoR